MRTAWIAVLVSGLLAVALLVFLFYFAMAAPPGRFFRPGTSPAPPVRVSLGQTRSEVTLADASGRSLAESTSGLDVEPALGKQQSLDDLGAWQALDALAPRDPNTPDWVHDASGSQPWVQPFAGVSLEGRQPGPRERLVGYSRQLEPTRELAQAAARRSAIDQLVVLSLWQMPDDQPGKLRDKPDLKYLQSILASLYQRELSDMVRAWYEQKVEVHRETMHRSALQIRAPITKVREVAEKAFAFARNERFQRRRESLTMAALLIGAAIGILGVYALLNAATKGHFAWTLRLLSAAAFGAIVFFLTLA